MLGEEIARRRQDMKLSQPEFANELQLPLHVVQAWEADTELPRKRDMELVDKILATHFAANQYQNLQYAHRVGPKTSIIKVILISLMLLGFDLFITGFGYQPTYIFLLVLFITTFITLPVFFDETWWITSHGFKRTFYSENTIRKTVQVFVPSLRDNEQISFVTIESVTIQYIPKPRFGPFDMAPDCFKLIVAHQGTTDQITIDHHLTEKMLATMLLLSSQDIIVRDPQKVLSVLNKHENLYRHFHEENLPAA